jgi:hypothetical protein
VLFSLYNLPLQHHYRTDTIIDFKETLHSMHHSDQAYNGRTSGGETVQEQRKKGRTVESTTGWT